MLWDTNRFLLDEAPARDPPIIFGSSVKRLMFPVHGAPTRLGIEQGVRGEPHIGPGTYSEHPEKLFLLPQDRRPRSKNGWYFGCRSAPRSSSIVSKSVTPSPAAYQQIHKPPPTPDYKPFNATCSRFPAQQYHTPNPGPGRYENHTQSGIGTCTPKKVEFHESFGGTKTLKDLVQIKCTNGIAETCTKCSTKQVGDYYDNGSANLCPKCYNSMKNALNPFRFRNTESYKKVRDCSEIHKHSFPGFPPRILIQTESEQRKFKHKLAYLRIHYKD